MVAQPETNESRGIVDGEMRSGQILWFRGLNRIQQQVLWLKPDNVKVPELLSRSIFSVRGRVFN